MADVKKRFNPMIIPITLFGMMALGMAYLGVGGIWYSLTGYDRCITGWDARYQPQYVAGQCSILQRGYRVPAPEYINPQNLYYPEGRE